MTASKKTFAISHYIFFHWSLNSSDSNPATKKRGITIHQRPYHCLWRECEPHFHTERSSWTTATFVWTSAGAGKERGRYSSPARIRLEVLAMLHWTSAIPIHSTRKGLNCTEYTNIFSLLEIERWFFGRRALELSLHWSPCIGYYTLRGTLSN